MSRITPFLAGAATSAVCWMILYIGRDGFAQGSTWSGLNPDGGGPGFLLLLTAAGLSLGSRTAFVRGLRPMPALFEAVVVSAACGVLFALLLRFVPPFESVNSAPLISGVAGAFFVPRVVMSVLEHAWASAEDPTDSNAEPA